MKALTKKKAISRLNRIEGQIRGLKRLVENDTYCIKIINQSLAVKSALSAVEDLILENHLSTHVAQQMKNGHQGKAVKEMVAVYKLSKKK